MVESILVTLFCCLPFGIAGIVNAVNVNGRYDGGDYEDAQRASAQAGKWTKIGFWIGIVVYVLWFGFMFLLGGAALLGRH
ncbi:CD225/dispanin family protein [Mucilaginibacter lacusdianchii]|uniref:CD225/dispanin family protein n=1 Tax=Mucilaginibacter lacusdianchii TaxID=2684211 RepID=UPI00131D8EC2